MLGGGIVNVIVSFIYGAVSGSDLFRNLFLVICIFFDASLYVFCLLWKPTEDNYYMGLIACVIFGFTDGVWSPLLDGKRFQLLFGFGDTEPLHQLSATTELRPHFPCS